MSSHKICAACFKPLQNLIDLHKADISGPMGGRVNLLVCYKHHIEFFLDGQSSFLFRHRNSIVQWLQGHGKPSDMGIIKEVLDQREKDLKSGRY